MIDLYTWTTPNGRKASIMLEELGLAYRAIAVDIGKGEQFRPEFLAIAPNNRIPAIVDHDNDDFSLMESGAILIYLAEKTGRLMSKEPKARMRTIEWLMWQMGGVGPMIGQAHHFLRARPDASEYAAERYREEARRLYGVLDRRLEGREYIVDEYSIADIATWPWIARFEWHQVDIREFTHVRRWYERIAVRPAVQRGYQVPAYTTPVPMPAD
ncbi:MAG: glutathione S-transferase N-terminal domain-containing protein [Rubrivivax sp.]|nr:glutathione S-transferase N-terminal domain-containing protein [Rubrivivax sp.]